MPVPDGYKPVEQIAVVNDQTYNRIQTAIKDLGIPQTVFAEDCRRSYYSSEAIAQIKKWLDAHK